MPLLNNRTHSLMIKITRICSPDVRMGQDEKERGHYLLKFVASYLNPQIIDRVGFYGIFSIRELCSIPEKGSV